jgi:hypothetical protein
MSRSSRSNSSLVKLMEAAVPTRAAAAIVAAGIFAGRLWTNTERLNTMSGP